MKYPKTVAGGREYVVLVLVYMLVAVVMMVIFVMLGFIRYILY